MNEIAAVTVQISVSMLISLDEQSLNPVRNTDLVRNQGLWYRIDHDRMVCLAYLPR